FLEVGAGVDDGRRLAAQLEGDAGQVLGGGGHHHLADGGRAGEEDVVERQLEQGGGDLDVALEDGDLVLVEQLAHDLDHQRRQVRRHLRRLEDGGVAGGDGRDQRAEGQVHRVV